MLPTLENGAGEGGIRVVSTRVQEHQGVREQGKEHELMAVEGPSRLQGNQGVGARNDRA